MPSGRRYQIKLVRNTIQIRAKLVASEVHIIVLKLIHILQLDQDATV